MTLFNAQKLFSSAPESGDEAAGRMRLLLSCLGNPERKLRILPVTGEKGKSSVVRIINGILSCSGIKSAAVIYPCLGCPKENVFLGDSSLSNESFTSLTDRLAHAVREAQIRAKKQNEPPLVFSRAELLFCLAVTAAENTGCKWLILEIPSGPFAPLSTVRFSAALTVVTSCGETIPQGILSMIHPGLSELVSARLPHVSAYQTIADACAKAGCRLTVPVFSNVSILESSLRRTVFRYRDREYTIPLYGDFALTNALCAIEAASALRRIDCQVTDRGIASGLGGAVLPARAEILSVSPTVLVDAADNPFSVEALTMLLKQKGTAIGNRITLCLEETVRTEQNAEPAFIPQEILAALFDFGFSIGSVIRIPHGKENRTASLLLKTASAGDLILAIGTLPFAFTMRTEFLKALKFH